jgi:transposase
MSDDIRAAYSAALHAVARCVAAPHLPEEQFVAFLDGLRESFGLRVAIGAIVRFVSGERRSEVLHSVQVGVLSADQQRVFQQLLSGAAPRPDPAFVESSRRFGDSSGVARRQELIADDVWYASGHVTTTLRDVGLDACLYAWLPCERDAASATSAAIVLHRAWGAPQFNRAESDAMQMLMPRLEPMLRAWVRSRSQGGAAIDLPRRLRGVLARLLAGDSEKAAAAKLGLSPHTVHQYIKFIHSRLGVKSRGELLAWCAQRGVTSESIGAMADAHDPTASRRRRGLRLVNVQSGLVQIPTHASLAPANGGVQ